MRQQTNIHHNFMTQHIDVQLIGNVANQFHEQITIVQCFQIPAAIYRLPFARVLLLIGWHRNEVKSSENPKSKI